MNQTTIIFDVDDFSPVRPGLLDLFKIKEHYPNFKVTCFTPALGEDMLNGKIEEKQFFRWIEFIKKYDWIEICPHGLAHLKGEMECSHKEALNIINSVEEAFEKYKIPYKKIWKSPYWKTSLEAYVALKEKGYVVAIDKNAPKPLVSELSIYQFNKCMSTPFDKIEKEIVKYHGHVAGRFYNDISLSMENIMTMPIDATFLTISEYIQKYGAEKI